MQRTENYARLSVVESLDLNGIQDGAAPGVVFKGLKRGLDIHCTGDGIIRVGPGKLCLGDNTEFTAENTTETTINPTGSLNVSSVHYVYAQIVAGVITYSIGGVVAGSPPDEGLIFKSGDTTKRFIGSFCTDSANNVLPFHKVGNRYYFRRSKVANTKFRIVTTGTTAWGIVELGPWIPPYVRLVHLMLHLYHTVGPNDAGVRTTGDTTFEQGRVYIPATGGALHQNQMHLAVECNNIPRIDVDCTGGTLDVYVTGYEERAG